MATVVIDPSGRSWRVSRRLFERPRFPGFGRPKLDTADGAIAGSGGGSFSDVLFGLALVVTFVLAVAFVWPLIVFALELLVAVVAVCVRAALGRWTVVAESLYERRSWPVRGRRASITLAGTVADALRHDGKLPPASAATGRVSPIGLGEAEIAHQPDSGHVRVL